MKFSVPLLVVTIVDLLSSGQAYAHHYLGAEESLTNLLPVIVGEISMKFHLLPLAVCILISASIYQYRKKDTGENM